MRLWKSIACELPVLRRILAERDELRTANAALAARVQELEAGADDVTKALKAAEAARLEAVASHQQANAERWAAVKQREEAEAARWEAVRQREVADAERRTAVRQREDAGAAQLEAVANHQQANAERWAAVKQREEAEAARWEAVRQREVADAERWTAVRQREDAEAAHLKVVQEYEAAQTEGRLSGEGPHLHTQSSAVRWEDRSHLEKQGIFVVGHARAGTSILMFALNTSPDICMLAEANLYQTGMRNRFAEWFNGMHASFRNVRAKESYCPPAPSPDANGVQALDWLSRRYRYVGEKLAFRSARLGYDPQAFLDFQAQHFGKSHYFCIIRNPLHVVKSNIEMFENAHIGMYSESYLTNMSLIADMYDLFPNVCVLTHESITSKTFEVIAGRLGTDLNTAFSLYEHEKFQRGDLNDFAAPHAAQLKEAYAMLAEAFSEDTLQIRKRRDLKKIQHRLAEMVRSLA